MLKIAHKKKPSQIESNLPTILFRGLCETSGVYTKKKHWPSPGSFATKTHMELCPILTFQKKERSFAQIQFLWFFWTVNFISFLVEEQRNLIQQKNPPPKARMLGSGWLVGWFLKSLTYFEGEKNPFVESLERGTSPFQPVPWVVVPGAPATSTWPVSCLLSPLAWTEGSMKGEGLRKVVKEWWNNLELPNQLNYQASIFNKKDESNHAFSRPSISTQHLTQLEKRLVEHFGTSRQSNHKPWIITIITIGWNVLKTFNSIMTLKLLESIR